MRPTHETATSWPRRLPGLQLEGPGQLPLQATLRPLLASLGAPAYYLCPACRKPLASPGARSLLPLPLQSRAAGLPLAGLGLLLLQAARLLKDGH